tara:strand:+ start:1192 stop:1581 length:390 start_codon:yes stop_codon:yes gene_type:complete
MAKKITRTKLVKKLDSIFSKYIRQVNSINEIATCFTCGKKDHWKKLQNGHFQSRRHYSTRWNELNCQVQCSGCNIFKSGEQFKFSQNLDKKFGKGTAQELQQIANQTIKFSSFELEEKIIKYENLVNQL